MVAGAVKRVGGALAVDFCLGLAETDFDREFHFAGQGASRIALILCGICAADFRCLNNLLIFND
jgi:hypothetical protein